LEPWGLFVGNPELVELANFAQLLLRLVVNQGGCEPLFSDLRNKQSDKWTRLRLEKLEKMAKVSFKTFRTYKLPRLCFTLQVGGSIKSEHQESGKSKQHVKQTNHRSTSTLLNVPIHSDLLDDQDNEDKAQCGRLLVRSAQGWRTEIAKWIGDAQRAVDNEDSDTEDGLPQARVSKWKPVTLAVLFAGRKEKFVRVSTQSLDQQEANLMEAIAEMDEDERLNDGAIKIPSDNEQWV
jgi:hypothetical protein